MVPPHPVRSMVPPLPYQVWMAWVLPYRTVEAWYPLTILIMNGMVPPYRTVEIWYLLRTELP